MDRRRPLTTESFRIEHLEPRTQRALAESMHVSLARGGGHYTVHAASGRYYDVDVVAQTGIAPTFRPVHLLVAASTSAESISKFERTVFRRRMAESRFKQLRMVERERKPLWIRPNPLTTQWRTLGSRDPFRNSMPMETRPAAAIIDVSGVVVKRCNGRVFKRVATAPIQRAERLETEGFSSCQIATFLEI